MTRKRCRRHISFIVDFAVEQIALPGSIMRGAFSKCVRIVSCSHCKGTPLHARGLGAALGSFACAGVGSMC
jgi:hypothetical protein